MYSAVGIAGSARRESNSTMLLEAVLEGCKKAGARTRMIRLAEIEPFTGCLGCMACAAPGGRCMIKDGAAEAIGVLVDAHIWIFAAPIYFDGICGRMKSFFDRLFWLIWRDGKKRPRLSGKRRAAVILTYEDKQREDYRREGEKIAFYLGWMGEFGTVEVIAEGNLGPPGAAAAREDLLARCRDVGRRLVEELNEKREIDEEKKETI